MCVVCVVRPDPLFELLLLLPHLLGRVLQEPALHGAPRARAPPPALLLGGGGGGGGFWRRQPAVLALGAR